MYANENLRNARLIKGYKQWYMGKQINITAQAYGKIERGETALTQEAAIIFALTLEVPFETIYTTKGTSTDKEKELLLELMQTKNKVIELQDILLKQKNV